MLWQCDFTFADRAVFLPLLKCADRWLFAVVDGIKNGVRVRRRFDKNRTRAYFLLLVKKPSKRHGGLREKLPLCEQTS